MRGCLESSLCTYSSHRRPTCSLQYHPFFCIAFKSEEDKGKVLEQCQTS